VSAGPNPSAFGQSVTLTAAVTPAGATGTVQFLDGGTALGTATISGGAAGLAVSTLAAGTHSIKAVYSGDGNYSGSTSGAITQTVSKAASSVSLSAGPNPSTVGQAVTLTAAVTPAGGTGTVQFLDGSTALGTATISGGTAALAVSTLAAGTHSITAVYSGDGNYSGSTSGAWTQTVSKVASTTLLSASPNPSVSGQSVSLTATISPTAATGSVQFFDGSTSLGTATVSGGSASKAVTTLSVGGHSITAVYSGDANYAASTSAAVTQTVVAALPPSNLTATAASYSQINLSWTASPTSGVKYNVYASSTSGFTPSAGNRIATGVSGTTYSNSGLAANTTFYYLVTAQDSAGESAPSNQASATTQVSCHVNYNVTSHSNGIFTTAITIQNTGSAPIAGWQLTWTFGGNQQITQSTDSVFAQSGANATLTNVSSDATIGAGATLTGVGFNASYSGQNQSPSVFYVNGSRCH
jgi:hypothetical protein